VRSGWTRMGAARKHCFSLSKASCSGSLPLPGGGFLGEIVEGASETGVVMNEPTIETCKTRNARTVLSLLEWANLRYPKFNGSIASWPACRRIPRYSTSSFSNSHFSRFEKS